MKSLDAFVTRMWERKLEEGERYCTSPTYFGIFQGEAGGKAQQFRRYLSEKWSLKPTQR